MILETQELLQLYEAVVKPFGHPDPLGYMARALLESEGDPDYIDVEGKRGFMPVDPARALEMTGASEIQSLQSNLVATLTMDRMLFEDYRSIDDMIIAFHYGDDATSGDKTKSQSDFIALVNEGRQDVHRLMYPPFATVKDVIKALDERNVDRRLSTDEKNFFSYLLKG